MKQPDNLSLNSVRFNAGPVGTQAVITAANINNNGNFCGGLIWFTSSEKQLGNYQQNKIECALLNSSMGYSEITDKLIL